ncbi:MAG: MurT ligase domain-containing protein [Candidatus Nanopelagicales bacterium]|nr:MurT ligase domain-containing protein [Candidatus Nanopelagicales bacterium]
MPNSHARSRAKARPRTRVAVAAGRIVSAASRAAGRGEGMVVGGKVILRLAPSAVTDLAAGRVAALVSATNGKTSTTRLLASALEQAGPVVSQTTGANMPTGIVMALARAPRTATAILEVDEAYLPVTVAQAKPRIVVLGNLTRDQLDRMNEVAMIARKWRSTLAELHDVVVIANADDPMVEFAAGAAANVIWVGAGQQWTADSTVCAQCGSLLNRDGPQWSCPGCGRSRPHPDWLLDYEPGAATATGPDGVALDLSDLRLPGRFNAANATLALAAVRALGLDPIEGLRRMKDVDSVSGRFATMRVGQLTVQLLLAKNPAGWSELLDIMPPAPTPIIVTINSNSADGRDPSWLWDVPFEKLRGRTVVATGSRRRDLAVRLTHAEVDYVVIEDPYAVGARLPAGMVDLEAVCCAATYTAFQELRTTGVPA